MLAFGALSPHKIKYRTLTWPYVAMIMTTEIVTGGTLTLPQAIAVVGLVPGLIIIIFCGVLALYTSFLLIDFKLNHPEVHSMGDAGYILFKPFGLGAVGREVLLNGTLLFAITASGSMELLGAEALASLSDSKLCFVLYTGIFAVPTVLCALPRTFGSGLSYLSVLACLSVLVACIVCMVGASVSPTPDRIVVAARPQTFYTAFLAITNPVLAFCGHFMFFPLLSEMKNPREAKKAAWCLQTFSTIFYAVFAVVVYVYIGSEVSGTAFLSLTPKWAKAAWGIIIPNLLIAGSLYNHAAAKVCYAMPSSWN